MGETLKLAVPTMGAADLASERSGHFGHCDCFTIVDIEDGEIKGTSELANPPHEEGGCLRPVGLLADAGVDAIVAAGMGMRPMIGFNDAGITVYFENQTPNVGEVAKLVAAGSGRSWVPRTPATTITEFAKRSIARGARRTAGAPRAF